MRMFPVLQFSNGYYLHLSLNCKIYPYAARHFVSTWILPNHVTYTHTILRKRGIVMYSKKVLTSIAITMSILFLSLNCYADISPDELAKASEARAVATSTDPLTTDLIEKKVKEACDLLGQKGIDAFAEFQGKDSKFIYAGTYIWIHDQNGIMRMHPIKHKLNGRNLINLTDSTGKLFFAVMNEVCEEKGSGWVDYMWPKPGEKKPSPKISYVKQVKFGDDIFVVGSGTYDANVIAKIKN